MNSGVQVRVAENECESGIQLTTESDGSLKIESVSSIFPECFTLAFKCANSGKWKVVEKKNEKFIPPQGGWGTAKYVCCKGTRVKFLLTNFDVKFTMKELDNYLESYGIVEVQKFDQNKSTTSVIIKFVSDDCLEDIRSQQHPFTIHEVVQIDREIFSKRPGTTNMGHEFEKLTMASLLLNLTTDENVEDFRMSSNDEEFGSFDDIVVDVNFTNGDEHKYAVQLKYKNDPKKSLKKYLTSVSSDFSIQKYFRDFTEMIEYTKKYNLILFTNLKLNAQEGELLKLDNTNVALKIVKEKLPQEFGEGFCYIFVPNNSEISDQHKMFFNKFLLFPDRPNVHKMEEDLFRKFDTEFSYRNIDNYLKFLTEWSNKICSKRLNKMFIKELIALQLLATTIKSFPFVKKEDSKEALYIKEATSNFTVTVVDEKYFDNVKKIWENETRNVIEIERVIADFQFRRLSNDERRVIALWIMNICPLIITESDTAYKVISLCREKHFMLLKKDNTLVPIQNVKVFTKLADVDSNSALYKNMTKTFQCSFQCKQAISIEDLIKQCKNFQNFVTTNELIQMLNGPLTIGEQETILNIYIDRLVTRLTIEYNFFDNVDKDTLIIISCQERETILKDRLKSFHLINIEDYLNQTEKFRTDKQTENVGRIQGKTAYFSKNMCTQETLDIIFRRNPNKKCHHFRIAEDEVFEWVYSQGEINDLQKYKTSSSFLKETDLFNTERAINIITADPGMGKTELMKKFSNMCSSSFWSVLIRARDWSEYLKREDCNIENFFEVVIENACKTQFEENILKVLKNARKIIFLWDGLDELSSTLIDTVINLIDFLAKEGFQQWISCRKHLEDKLEKKFSVLSRSIKQFDQNEQRRYISERLRKKEINLEEVVYKINNYIDRVQYSEILGIPLQIFMLTELLLNHPNVHTLLDEVFPITDLYKYFVEMKFQIFFKEKNNFKEVNFLLQSMMRNFQEEQLKYHQKTALAIIEDDLLEKLDITLNSPVSDETIYGIGIITGKTVDGKSIFLHYSYAEYFVALYLYENRDKFNVLFNEHIFQENYQNVRFMFDLLLAKNCAPHLAVLYNNFEYLKSCKDYTCRDEGGRNPLQIACAWGPRFPLLKTIKQGDDLFIDDEQAGFVDLSRRQHYDEMINLLLEHNNVLDKDLFFHLNAVEYADLSLSLKPLEIFSKERYDLTFNTMKNFNDISTVIYYSVKFNYTSILCSFQNIPFLKTVKNSNTILHLASENNAMDCIKILLRDKNYRSKIDTVDQYGRTPIYVAASNGHYEVVEYLVKSGADVNIRDQDGWSPIHIAAYNAYLDLVKLFVGLITDVNAKTEEGYTPLHTASASGHCDIIDYLVKSGADVNIRDEAGWAPIHTAAKYGRAEAVEYLSKLGSGLDIRDRSGWYPLHTAAQNGLVEVVRLLVDDLKADVNAKDYQGYTPMYVAAAGGHCEVVEYLAKSGADVNIQNENGFAPIHVAAKNGLVEVIELLEKSGADVNIPDQDGWIPVHVAAQNGHVEAVRLFVGDLNVNSKTKEGCTPLYNAAAMGHCEVIEYLAKSGADVNIQDRDGWVALHMAAQNGHIEVVKLLVGDLKTDVNAKTKKGYTPLYNAAAMGHCEVVEYLVKLGADVDIRDQDGWSPIHIAAHKGHIDVVKLFIGGGLITNVDMKTEEGYTLLCTAAINGHCEIVEYLAKSGADVNIQDQDGWVALHMAAEKGYVEVVRLLVDDLKADVNLKTNKGFTPSDIAAKNGHDEVVQYLKNQNA